MSLVTNLVSYWKLSDTSDSVGSNTLTNNGSATFVAGKIGNAVSLNGSSQYLSCTAPNTLTRTVSLWFKTSITNAYQEMFSQNRWVSGTNYNVFEFRLTNAGKIQIAEGEQSSGAGGTLTSSASYATATWVHAVVVFNGTAVQLYTNGTLTDSATWTRPSLFTVDSNGTQIGGFAGQPTENFYFNGNIDEVGLWSRALSSTEVTALYNGGAGNQYPFGIGTTYTLTADVGSFALTGYSTTYIRLRNMVASVGNFALTGYATTMSKGKGIAAQVGSFILTGFAATLTWRGWQAESKHAGSYTAETKNSSTWTPESKNN